MDKITFPIAPENIGDAVPNLQVGLRFLTDKGFYRFHNQQVIFVAHPMEE